MSTKRKKRKNDRDLAQWFFVGLGFLLIFIGPSSQALTLDDYLTQVKKQNLDYQSGTEKAEGYLLQSREADLTFAPDFFADATLGEDEKPTSPHYYDSLKTQTYNVGFEQTFRFGLEAKLYYQLMETKFINPNPLLTDAQYWDATPQLELTLPLWGGGFGRSDQANQTIARQQNLAQKYSSQAEALNTLAQAESTYWRLSVAREVLNIQEKALTAAQDIYNYVSKKMRMNLGEKADVIQAQALLDSRQLELQRARNEERAAQREFNKFLHRDAFAPVENLDPIDYARLEKFSLPQERPGTRADVKAVEAQTETAKAQALLSYEKNRPTLDLFGKFALYGRNEKLQSAFEQSGRRDYDADYVGVRFKMPLHFGAAGDVKSGAKQLEKAWEINKEQAFYLQEQDWIYLTQTLEDARKNLELSSKMETTQKEKLATERVRFHQGRTTTYQVLLFEQDYSQAAISKAQSAAQILDLLTQVQLYQNSGRNSL
jgi:outer membrane protein TolC